jgi:hypothetical protein
MSSRLSGVTTQIIDSLNRRYFFKDNIRPWCDHFDGWNLYFCASSGKIPVYVAYHLAIDQETRS